MNQNRAKNLERFPYQYAGRALNSRRLNRGKVIDFFGNVLGEMDTRQSSGNRTFETARYTKGRHPQESVAHYEARNGR